VKMANKGLLNNVYNPDVLSCLANLSNDEVFTPPDVVNAMLDMLPQELFQNPDTTFLDPACKTGVFLREIAKRLIKGLESQYPDLQERIDHIFREQLYGIAITELTSLLSRRGVYCSKYPNSEFSVTQFDNAEGNIRYRRIQHKWKDGKCLFCGAPESQYERGEELETHAYEWIHTNKPEEIFNMKFDVIISNPPYQLSDGGNNASATPIYDLFVEKAIRLNPRYVAMIIPSRWYCGGRGLDDFRKKMLTSGHLSELHDYKRSSDCFPGIRNGGGICYFLWDSSYKSTDCRIVEHNADGISSDTVRSLTEFGEDLFIRDTKACEIIRKILAYGEKSFSEHVWRQKPYGFRTNFMDFDNQGDVKIYTKKQKSGYAYIKNSKVTVNRDTISMWKVVTSRSTSVPEEDNGQVLRLSQTFIAEPGSVVTESYVVLGAYETEREAKNCLSYLYTRLFRFLCQPTIVSPDVSKRTFLLVPEQSYESDWDDARLYKKYNLSTDDIAYIESMIIPAGNRGDDSGN